MTRYARTLAVRLLLALALLLLVAPAAAAQVFPTSEPPMREFVVELDWEQDPELYSGYFLSTLDVDPNVQAERVNHIYTHAINGFSVLLTSYEAKKAERVFGNGGGMGIKALSPSMEFSLPVVESTLSSTTIANAQGDVTPVGLARIQAGAPAYPAQFSAVDVAVIDTGVDRRHSQLNVVGGIDCIGDNARTWGVDGHGHGTHVAGTIAARYDGEGVIGVAPGARIHSVRVLDANGGGSTASLLCGIDYVAANPQIAVANMSLGGSGVVEPCGGKDSLRNAICTATENTIFVVAAGNSAADAINHSPANYAEQVVTVAAYTDYDGQPGGLGIRPGDRCHANSVDDELATFSNYGPVVDIAAPGVCVLSTLPTTLDQNGDPVDHYAYMSGTSMASPHVAGALARFLAQSPDQRDFAVGQMLMWSNAFGGTAYRGCHADACAPLLFIGDGFPRYEVPFSTDPALPPPTNISR